VDVRKYVEEKGDWTVQGVVDEAPILITPHSSIANVVLVPSSSLLLSSIELCDAKVYEP